MIIFRNNIDSIIIKAKQNTLNTFEEKIKLNKEIYKIQLLEKNIKGIFSKRI